MAQLVWRGLASADRLPVVVRIPAGPLGSLKCDPPKGNGCRPQKTEIQEEPAPASPGFFSSGLADVALGSVLTIA